MDVSSPFAILVSTHQGRNQVLLKCSQVLTAFVRHLPYFFDTWKLLLEWNKNIFHLDMHHMNELECLIEIRNIS